MKADINENNTQQIKTVPITLTLENRLIEKVFDTSAWKQPRWRFHMNVNSDFNECIKQIRQAQTRTGVKVTLSLISSVELLRFGCWLKFWRMTWDFCGGDRRSITAAAFMPNLSVETQLNSELTHGSPPSSFLSTQLYFTTLVWQLWFMNLSHNIIGEKVTPKQDLW